MRLATAVLAIAILAPIEASAQRRFAGYVRRAFDYRAVEVGVVGGPNRSSVTGAGPIDARFRGMLGGFASVRLGDGLRLRPEVIVSGKQVATSTSIFAPCLPPGPCAETVETETTSFTWLEAPLLLEYRFDQIAGRFGPKLYAGPFMAIRIGCSLAVSQAPPLEADGDRLVRSCATEHTGNTRFNNGDAGFVAGGGIGTGSVGLGFRWIRSLVEVAPFQPAGTSRLIGAKQSTVAVTLEFSTRVW
jgi:hypothetical protein